MTLDEFKGRSKLMWSTGDYRPTSRQLAPAADALVESLGIAAGHRVLDIAAGDGNCALAAARCGAAVAASDFSPAMIEAGRMRTDAAGVDVDWREADAAQLPYEDGSFDFVTSVFGIIFAPEQEQAAAEAVRVTRSSGRFGFTAWTEDSFAADLMAIMRRYGPPVPADAPEPLRWGRVDEVEEIFGALGCAVEIRPKAVRFRYPSWDEGRASLEAHGGAVLAKQNMPEDRYQEMLGEIRGAIERRNYGTGDGLAYDSDYLEVLVTPSNR